MTEQGAGADIDVVQNEDAQRFEARMGDEVAGFVDYVTKGDVVVMTHTEVEPQHEGQGVASRLVGGALDQLRDAGLRVGPQCSYVASYIRKHSEYADLVAQ
jgi:uncharacterized protein